MKIYDHGEVIPFGVSLGRNSGDAWFRSAKGVSVRFRLPVIFAKKEKYQAFSDEMFYGWHVGSLLVSIGSRNTCRFGWTAIRNRKQVYWADE